MRIELDEMAIRSLARSPEVRAKLVAEAEAVAKAAQGVAQREFYATGAYMRGIRAVPVTLPTGELAGQVQATDYKSAWAEFGWTDEAGTVHAPKAVLRRGAESLGLRPKALP